MDVEVWAIIATTRNRRGSTGKETKNAAGVKKEGSSDGKEAPGGKRWQWSTVIIEGAENI